MFGEDAVTSTDSNSRGFVLDSTQIKVLEDSWRCPSNLTAYKEIYRLNFPVSSEYEETLPVPSLDNMIETLLVKKYGSKCSKSQSLCYQPLRSLEKMAHQGQNSTQMGLIINHYMKQALTNFLSVLQSDKLGTFLQCLQNLLIKWHVQMFSIISFGEWPTLVYKMLGM
jgi:hypothetical protein